MEKEIGKLDREYARLFKRIEKALSGGLCYGIDWPTACAVMPVETSRMRDIMAEIKRIKGY